MENPQNRHIVLDVIAPVFTLQVGEVTYSMCYDASAISHFFKATEINALFEPVGKNPLQHVMLIWSGLTTHHPDLSIEEVFSWYNQATAKGLMEIVFRALHEQTRGWNHEEAEDKPNPPSA